MTQWSAQQEAIFTWFASTDAMNLVVRARAGTGKTTTIVEGVLRAPESRILLAAFNKKIAVELTERVQGKSNRVEAKTLHSLGYEFIRRSWKGCRVDANRGGIIAGAVCGSRVPDSIIRMVARLASRCKSTCPFPASLDSIVAEAEAMDLDLELPADSPYDVNFLADRTQAAMQMACEKDGSVDFDDMVYVPLANNWVRGQYDLVVVDEAQDMCMSQIMLAQRACKQGGRIAVVGDDRQAIYGFRGADSGSIDRLKRELEAKELGLSITYRCPKRVVAMAQKFVPDYEAAPNAPDGVVEQCDERSMFSRVQAGDFVLSRKNAPLARICLSLLRSGKRARIEGRDIGAQLIGIVQRVAGKKVKALDEFTARLQAWHSGEQAKAQKLDEYRREARLQFVADQYDTILALMDGLTTVAELVARLEQLFTNSDDKGYIQSCVTCSSVHRAKGLERDRVFTIEDTFRYDNIEERNIRYVALTRAKRELYLVSDSFKPEEEAAQ